MEENKKISIGEIRRLLAKWFAFTIIFSELRFAILSNYSIIMLFNSSRFFGNTTEVLRFLLNYFLIPTIIFVIYYAIKGDLHN